MWPPRGKIRANSGYQRKKQKDFWVQGEQLEVKLKVAALIPTLTMCSCYGTQKNNLLVILQATKTPFLSKKTFLSMIIGGTLGEGAISKKKDKIFCVKISLPFTYPGAQAPIKGCQL